MKFINKILLATVPIALLSACGGSSDVTQAIGTSDPQVRLARFSPFAPPLLTLARNGSNRPEATDYNKSLSDYFTVDTGNADYRVSGQSGTFNPGSSDYAFSQTINFDARRGHKYTILVVGALPPGGGGTGGTARWNTLVLVDDPPHPSPLDDQSYLRAVNGSFNAQNIDIYLIGLTETIGTLTPDLPSIEFKQSNPVSGSDSIRRRGGDYQVVVTTAGTKNILYRGRITIPDKRDVLFVTFASGPTFPSEDPYRSGVGIVAILTNIQGDGGTVARISLL